MGEFDVQIDDLNLDHLKMDDKNQQKEDFKALIMEATKLENDEISYNNSSKNLTGILKPIRRDNLTDTYKSQSSNGRRKPFEAQSQSDDVGTLSSLNAHDAKEEDEK